MIRWITCLAAMAALFASTNELEAQRKAPLRNMMRNIGHGWSGGNHLRNPGYNTSYYTPWSSHNATSQSANEQPTPAPVNDAGQDIIPYTPGQNSIWNPPRNDHQVQPIMTQVPNSAWNSVLDDMETSLNPEYTPKRLQPYSRPKPNPNAIQLKHGGNFKVPGQNIEWKSQQ